MPPPGVDPVQLGQPPPLGVEIMASAFITRFRKVIEFGYNVDLFDSFDPVHRKKTFSLLKSRLIIQSEEHFEKIFPSSHNPTAYSGALLNSVSDSAGIIAELCADASGHYVIAFIMTFWADSEYSLIECFRLFAMRLHMQVSNLSDILFFKTPDFRLGNYSLETTLEILSMLTLTPHPAAQELVPSLGLDPESTFALVSPKRILLPSLLSSLPVASNSSCRDGSILHNVRNLLSTSCLEDASHSKDGSQAGGSGMANQIQLDRSSLLLHGVEIIYGSVFDLSDNTSNCNNNNNNNNNNQMSNFENLKLQTGSSMNPTSNLRTPQIKTSAFTFNSIKTTAYTSPPVLHHPVSSPGTTPMVTSPPPSPNPLSHQKMVNQKQALNSLHANYNADESLMCNLTSSPNIMQSKGTGGETLDVSSAILSSPSRIASKQHTPIVSRLSVVRQAMRSQRPSPRTSPLSVPRPQPALLETTAEDVWALLGRRFSLADLPVSPVSLPAPVSVSHAANSQWVEYGSTSPLLAIHIISPIPDTQRNSKPSVTLCLYNSSSANSSMIMPPSPANRPTFISGSIPDHSILLVLSQYPFQVRCTCDLQVNTYLIPSKSLNEPRAFTGGAYIPPPQLRTFASVIDGLFKSFRHSFLSINSRIREGSDTIVENHPTSTNFNITDSTMLQVSQQKQQSENKRNSSCGIVIHPTNVINPSCSIVTTASNVVPQMVKQRFSALSSSNFSSPVLKRSSPPAVMTPRLVTSSLQQENNIHNNLFNSNKGRTSIVNTAAETVNAILNRLLAADQNSSPADTIEDGDDLKTLCSFDEGNFFMNTEQNISPLATPCLEKKELNGFIHSDTSNNNCSPQALNAITKATRQNLRHASSPSPTQQLFLHEKNCKSQLPTKTSNNNSIVTTTTTTNSHSILNLLLKHNNQSSSTSSHNQQDDVLTHQTFKPRKTSIDIPLPYIVEEAEFTSSFVANTPDATNAGNSFIQSTESTHQPSALSSEIHLSPSRRRRDIGSASTVATVSCRVSESPSLSNSASCKHGLPKSTPLPQHVLNIRMDENKIRCDDEFTDSPAKRQKIDYEPKSS